MLIAPVRRLSRRSQTQRKEGLVDFLFPFFVLSGNVLSAPLAF